MHNCGGGSHDCVKRVQRDQQASGAALTGKALFEEGQSMPRFREKQGIELN
jgi:hypothetical protein